MIDSDSAYPPPPPDKARCPHCGAKCVERERGLNGNDKCENGHVYPSKASVY